MTPQISDSSSGTSYLYREPNLTYRVGEKTVAGKIDKLEAVKQSVRHILSTERYSNPIYGDNYGVELEQYVGADLGVIVAGIETTLNEALCQDDRITAVIVNNIEKSTKQDSACVIEFSVSTIYGNYSDNLEI